MKALKITFEHGRIWRAETSDGKIAQASTLEGALKHLVPLASKDEELAFSSVTLVFDGIRDSGHSTGQIARGQASG